MKTTIELFMWGYQPHFAHSVQRLAERVLDRIGLQVKPQVLLVGVRRPGVTDVHPVCVEPEDGDWPLSLFAALDRDVEAAIPRHELQSMFYGDAAAMRDKPDNIRRVVIREQVKGRLVDYDAAHGVVSFVGAPQPVAGHLVATVVQLPADPLSAIPTLSGMGAFSDDRLEANFVHVCVEQVLAEAASALLQPDPGRSVGMDLRPPDEIIRQAAASYMRRIAMLSTPGSLPNELFPLLNQLSAMRYEGAQGSGRLLLVDPNSPDMDYVLRLEKPVDLTETRWARKLLEMSSPDTALIASAGAIHGLGRLAPEAAVGNRFAVDFQDNHQWILSRGEDRLLRSVYGEAQLPGDAIRREVFEDNAARIFTGAGPADIARLWDVFQLMVRQPRGNMVVICEDAAAEAERLAGQGTRIAPAPVTDPLLQHACRIDGTILIDPRGFCHAVGVILDGGASDKCTPSRGARYNSAVRYVEDAARRRMAIVVSDDRTVDILPLLRPRVALAEIEAALDAFAVATPETHHKPRLFLDRHRFYLDADQCARANAALARLEKMPREGIWIVTEPWRPHPEMNSSYLK